MYIHVYTWYVHGMYILLYKHVCTLFRRVCTCLCYDVHVLIHINMYLQCTTLYMEWFWAWCPVSVKAPHLLSQSHSERNTGSGSIMLVLPMLLTWSTAFVERTNISCVLTVRYIQALNMYVHVMYMLCQWYIHRYTSICWQMGWRCAGAVHIWILSAWMVLRWQ